MSSGIEHHRVWRKGWKVALPLSLLTYGAVDPLPFLQTQALGVYISGNLFASLGVIIGYAIGRYVDPDLDLMGASASEGRLVNEIPIFGVFLYGHWATYGAIFRRHHRSVWTHGFFISTLLRFFYQFYGLFLILFLKEWTYPWIIQTFLGIFIGMCFADSLHIWEDWRSGELRRRTRK